MTITSDRCPAFREVYGRIDKCRKSSGHITSSVPRDREHYDPDHGGRSWMEHTKIDTYRVMTGNTFRARCTCGYDSSNGTRSVAERLAEQHRRDVEHLTEVNGLFLEPGDTVKAKLTSFDGPIHLLGLPLTVVKLGRTKVHVSNEGQGGHAWAVTAATLELVERGKP